LWVQVLLGAPGTARLKRRNLHGLIKKVGKTYKYYLTSLGKQVIVAGLSFKSMQLIPNLAMNS